MPAVGPSEDSCPDFVFCGNGRRNVSKPLMKIWMNQEKIRGNEGAEHLLENALAWYASQLR